MGRWVSTRIWLSVVALFVLAACGGDADTSATTAAGGGEDSADGGVSHEEASSEQLEAWQTELNAVGCWAGPVDGTLGPQTQAAIEAFQAAAGLEVDGLLGPVTEGALEEAVSAGEIVCHGDDTSTDGDSSGGGDAAENATATLSSSGYGPVDFTIGACSSSGESDIELQAEVENMTLTVDADMATASDDSGAGTLSVDGGTEGDGITLNGRVESVSVGDAGNFTVTGMFEAPNLEGEEFTLTGSCA